MCGHPATYCRFLFSSCLTRAFTIFFISAVGSGLSTGKWMVPLEVEKPFSSSLNSAMTEAVGNRLQWSENAANHTRMFLRLNAGILLLMVSLASDGSAERIAGRL